MPFRESKFPLNNLLTKQGEINKNKSKIKEKTKLNLKKKKKISYPVGTKK
jgi:hypothetical protein